jgi:hypothetical protein
MERVVQVLRALLRRALGEGARDAPALTDVVIESAAEPRLWVQFSNGFRASAPLRPEECFGFCERHAAWDIESLRFALLGEGRRLYAQMLQDQAPAGPTSTSGARRPMSGGCVSSRRT